MKALRYLTKTRDILGFDCPTKLFYTGKPEYPDQRTYLFPKKRAY